MKHCSLLHLICFLIEAVSTFEYAAPEYPQPDYEPPPYQQPDYEPPPYQQPDYSNSNNGEPDNGNFDYGQPDNGNFDYGQPDNGGYEYDPSNEQRGLAPDYVPPYNGKPDNVQPENPMSNDDQPGYPPAALLSDYAPPNIGQPNNVQPDNQMAAIAPNQVPPNNKPPGLASNYVPPNNGQPDNVQPENGQPGSQNLNNPEANNNPPCQSFGSGDTDDQIVDPILNVMKNTAKIVPIHGETMDDIKDRIKSAVDAVMDSSSDSCDKPDDADDKGLDYDDLKGAFGFGPDADEEPNQDYDHPDSYDESPEVTEAPCATTPVPECTKEIDSKCREECLEKDPLTSSGHCELNSQSTSCVCGEDVPCNHDHRDVLCQRKCSKRYGDDYKTYCRVPTDAGDDEFVAKRECVCQLKNETYAYS